MKKRTVKILSACTPPLALIQSGACADKIFPDSTPTPWPLAMADVTTGQAICGHSCLSGRPTE